jgi:hypothetical protein
MMEECCILYLHHRNDDVTRQNYELLRRNNPWPVVPIHANQPEHLPSAINVARDDRFRDETDVWRYSDNLIYRFFEQGHIQAKRYISFEWDTYATAPVQQHYAEVWDCDAAGPGLYYPHLHGWYYWFCETGRMPSAFRTCAAAFSPLCGVMLSRRALEDVTAGEIPNNVYCELRLATVVRAAKYSLCQLPTPKSGQNAFDLDSLRGDCVVPGIYHPVKFLI